MLNRPPSHRVRAFHLLQAVARKPPVQTAEFQGWLERILIALFNDIVSSTPSSDKPAPPETSGPGAAFNVPGDLIPGPLDTLEDVAIEKLLAEMAALDAAAGAQSSFPDPQKTGACWDAYNHSLAKLEPEEQLAYQRMNDASLSKADRDKAAQQYTDVSTQIAKAYMALSRCLSKVAHIS